MRCVCICVCMCMRTTVRACGCCECILLIMCMAWYVYVVRGLACQTKTYLYCPNVCPNVSTFLSCVFSRSSISSSNVACDAANRMRTDAASRHSSLTHKTTQRGTPQQDRCLYARAGAGSTIFVLFSENVPTSSFQGLTRELQGQIEQYVSRL